MVVVRIFMVTFVLGRVSAAKLCRSTLPVLTMTIIMIDDDGTDDTMMTSSAIPGS